MYSEALLHHFQAPRNVGEMALPDGDAEGENPICGDRLNLSLRVSGSRIECVRWTGDGCAPAIAAASVLSELVTGMSIADAREVSREDVSSALGGLPARKAHAATLALSTLRAALDDHRERAHRQRPAVESATTQ